MSGGVVIEHAWGEAAGEGIPRHRLADVVNAPGRRVELIAQCGACGEGVDDKAFALCCTSCGAALVGESDLTEAVRPDVLLPFALDEGAARAAFLSWVAHRRFAPSSLRGGARVRTLEGAYLPFWVFGAATYSTYAGRRGEHRTRQVPRTRTGANGQVENYTATESYTHWRRVSGAVSRVFDGVVVPACSPLPDKLPRWPLAGLCPLPWAAGARGVQDVRQDDVQTAPRVIAYDVDPEYGFTQATARMSAQIGEDVRLDIGGDTQQVRDLSTAYEDESCTLLLLPAWLVSYQYGGRGWSALVNGATGEAAGHRPYSSAKISLLVGAVALAAAVITLLVIGR